MKRKIFAEQGQAMLEFALVLPVFLMILFGIMELGWIYYQRATFVQGCAYAGWDITAEKLNDSDAYVTIGENKIYTGSDVENAIKDAIDESGILKIDESRISISGAKAVFYNKRSEFSVPGIHEGTHTNAENVTRYMELEASLTYKTKSLTGLADLLGIGEIDVKKDIDCLRVVGEQHRSE